MNNKKYRVINNLITEVNNLRSGNVQEEYLALILKQKNLSTEVESLKGKLSLTTNKIDIRERVLPN